MHPVGCVTGLFRSPLCTAQHQRPCSFSELSLTLIWMILISLTVISDRLLFLGHYVNNYAEPRSTVPHIHTFFGYYFFDVISVCLLFYVHISVFILMSHCLLSWFCFVLRCCIFHLHNDQSIHFYVVVFFSFLLLLFFLLFKQIKRFLLNMQAIVSSPSPWLHSASYCLCVCVCLWVCACPSVCSYTRWVLTSVFARGAECVRRRSVSSSSIRALLSSQIEFIEDAPHLLVRPAYECCYPVLSGMLTKPNIGFWAGAVFARWITLHNSLLPLRIEGTKEVQLQKQKMDYQVEWLDKLH